MRCLGAKRRISTCAARTASSSSSNSSNRGTCFSSSGGQCMASLSFSGRWRFDPKIADEEDLVLLEMLKDPAGQREAEGLQLQNPWEFSDKPQEVSACANGSLDPYNQTAQRSTL